MKEPFLEPLLRWIRFNKVFAHIKPNSVILDIGCGHTPHLLNRLETHIKKGIGIDQLVRGRLSKQTRLISTVLGKTIPVRSNSVDHVTLVAVLEHLQNPESIIKDAHRVLKKGGTIIITTPSHLNKPLLEFLSFKLGWVSQREIREHKRYYWGHELAALLKRGGFTQIKHTYFELFLNNFIQATK